MQTIRPGERREFLATSGSKPVVDIPRAATSLRGAAWAISLTVVVLGVAVLLGWGFDVGWLKSVLPGLVTMKPNTALSFVLAGIALALQDRSGPMQLATRVRMACALLVAVGGALTWVEYIAVVDLGFDDILGPVISGQPESPGAWRMAPNTALCFALLGTALVVRESSPGKLQWIAEWSAIAGLLVSATAVVGYILGAQALYGVAGYSSMAIHTAAGLSILAVGVLASRPEQGIVAIIAQDNPAGATIRYLLPLIIVTLVGVAWVRLKGQQFGLYGTEFGLALMVIASATIITALSLWNARVQGISHAEKESYLRELTARQAELEQRVGIRTAELTAALRERETLLQEVHHRVKNNLQVISSLIRMQVRRLSDSHSRAALEECQSRVQSIALIHEKLYQTQDYSHVPMAQYIRGLVANILHVTGAAPDTIEFELELDELTLAVDRAIPCGLLLNELVTNALKHAFPDGRGRLGVEFRKVGTEEVVLAVTDNGAGLPAGFDLAHCESLGMQLVATLIEQIEGRLELDRSAGTSFRITFPAESSS